jgi:hypothetical protein
MLEEGKPDPGIPIPTLRMEKQERCKTPVSEPLNLPDIGVDTSHVECECS